MDGGEAGNAEGGPAADGGEETERGQEGRGSHPCWRLLNVRVGSAVQGAAAGLVQCGVMGP